MRRLHRFSSGFRRPATCLAHAAWVLTVAISPVRVLTAQDGEGRDTAVARDEASARPAAVSRPARPARPAFRSRADSIDWAAARARAERSAGLRIVVSTGDRRLWALYDQDTLMAAPIAVAKNVEFDYAGRSWTFRTPRGQRTVLRKQPEPVWTPPDWHYAEVAREYGLRLVHLPQGRPYRLRDGRVLAVRDGQVGISGPDLPFTFLPLDEEVVFDNALFIPPIGTKNRRIEGELGHFALDLGDGYMLHGTPYKNSIGTASTHGCIRLHDDDIAWLFEVIPVGTKVYIY